MICDNYLLRDLQRLHIQNEKKKKTELSIGIQVCNKFKK